MLYNVYYITQLFVYPNNVAFPFGGDGQAQYVVLELHFDNPQMIPGTKKSYGQINRVYIHIYMCTYVFSNLHISIGEFF